MAGTLGAHRRLGWGKRYKLTRKRARTHETRHARVHACRFKRQVVAHCTIGSPVPSLPQVNGRPARSKQDVARAVKRLVAPDAESLMLGVLLPAASAEQGAAGTARERERTL